MKNTYKMLAVIAVAALLTASTAPSYAHSTTAKHKASHHKAKCKKDRDGHCLSFFGALARKDDSWHGTRKQWQNQASD